MPWGFEVEMINKIIKCTPLKIFLLTYLTAIPVLYPVSRMYANEYETVPIWINDVQLRRNPVSH